MKLCFDSGRQVLYLDDPKRDALAVRVLLRRMGGHWDGSRWEFPATVWHYRTLLDSSHSGLEGVGVDWVAQDWFRNERIRQVSLQDVREFGVDRAWKGFRIFPPSKLDPYDHQVVGSYILGNFSRFLLLDEMGLGKTKMAIDAVTRIGAKRVVIVCPNSVKAVWKEEIEKNFPYEPFVVIPAGSTSDRKGQIETTHRGVDDARYWIVLNYEALRYFPDEFYAACKDSVLILDEVHRLKNGRAKVTKIIKEAQPSRIWGLTGTPVANRPEDVWSLIDLMRPGLAGWTWFEFDHKHILRNKFGGIWKYKNLESVANQLSVVSLGRKKDQCLDLPEKVFEKRIVELSSEEARAYKDMKEKLVAWMDAEVGEVPTMAQAATFSVQFIRLRQIVDGFTSEGVAGSSSWSKALTKINAALEVWEDAGRPPMVVWCQWVPVIAKLVEETKALSLHGGVPIEKRAGIVDAWNKDLNGLLICQMDTAGEGLNLQHASLEVFLDAPITPKQRLQCVDRLHRIGQKNAVTIVDIVAEDTVDERVLKMLDQKIEWAQNASSQSFAPIKDKTTWKSLLCG